MSNVREIGLNAADLPKNIGHFAQQIECDTVGFSQLNSKTIQRHNSVVDEAATPSEDGDFASHTNSIFSQRHSFLCEVRYFRHG